jgi:hypothetical protein
MTLNEKFKQWLDTKPRLQIRDVQLEVIADAYAVEFAEWLLNRNIPDSTLKAFKKEKGYEID